MHFYILHCEIVKAQSGTSLLIHIQKEHEKYPALMYGSNFLSVISMIEQL